MFDPRNHDHVDGLITRISKIASKDKEREDAYRRLCEFLHDALYVTAIKRICDRLDANLVRKEAKERMEYRLMNLPPVTREQEEEWAYREEVGYHFIHS